MMNLKETLQNEYGIHSIKSLNETKRGSGRTYLLVTKDQMYIVKLHERMDFLRIYSKVEKYLNENGLIQSKIKRTKDGDISTKDGIVLYEYLNGENNKQLNDSQIKNSIQYIKKYNELLKKIPFSEAELTIKNHWDQAGNLSFQINEFPTMLSNINIDGSIKDLLLNAIMILNDNMDLISKDKQLIHSDLGPDNIMFNKDEVLSIIDFTPQIHHELYSISQYIYWNYLWEEKKVDDMTLKYILSVYFNKNINEKELKTIKVLIVQACLFRIIGPLLEMNKNNSIKVERLNKRIDLLKISINHFKNEGGY